MDLMHKPKATYLPTYLTIYHSYYMFLIDVRIMSKSIHFVIMLVIVIHVTIVVSASNRICNYILMDPNFNQTCDNNLLLS
jgi:hypothetical protein